MQDPHLAHPTFTSRVVPVIVLTDAAQAVPLAHALLEGGIDVMEITLRSDVALDAIEAVARAVPGMHLGAGTVTRASDVPRVIDAGARFALSPGCTDALVDAVRCHAPGFIFTTAYIRLLAEAQSEGRALLACCNVKGTRDGMRKTNRPEFHSEDWGVAMAGGSWLTPVDALTSGDWGRITRLARGAVEMSRAK